MFQGSGPRRVNFIVEEGDEANLYHNGNLVVTAKISSIKGNQMVGMITRSEYDPDLHPELTIGKEICFLEENIVLISKMTKEA